MATTSHPTTERRTELDALRVLVVVGLVFFHTALVFDARDDFYVKNADTTGVTLIVSGLGVLWAMPLLFFIAGLGAWHSLGRRGTGAFVAERLRRLAVPLAFGTLTIVPVPQWLRLRSDPAYHESYLQFLPRFFQVHVELNEFPFVLQGEYFETGHLWFLVLLLTFSLLLAPAAHRLRAAGGFGERPAGGSGERPAGGSGERSAGSFGERSAGSFGERMAAYALRWRGTTLLPAVPLAVFCALAGLEQEYAAWNRWAYLIFFLFGFAFATDERFRIAVRRDTHLAVAAGLALFLVGVPAMLAAGDGAFTDLRPLPIAGRALFGAAGWCWLMSILGLLDRPRPPRPRSGGGPRRWYAYLAEAALPLYVLHQPIVVAVAYGVVGWHAPIAVKFVVIVVTSFALIFAAYDLLVRRTNVTRFLFGMRPKP